MLSSTILNLFKRSPPPMPAQVAFALDKSDVPAPVRVEPKVRTVWPAARLALAYDLWGPGFTSPGGDPEVLRLARPLGLSSAASLLIVGVGGGGSACVVAQNLGAWVTGVENDPGLLAAAQGFVTKAKMGKKVSIKPWDPENPDFGTRSHHHCLALEPFGGVRPELILDALARSLKPNGQIVITELTASAPLLSSDNTVRRWADLENRHPGNVVTDVSMTRMLGRIGFDVRVAEDISQRHVEHALLGWRVMLRNLGEARPDRLQAVQLVREAELWLLRRRLIRDGRLRMMRWHAIGPRP